MNESLTVIMSQYTFRKDLLSATTIAAAETAIVEPAAVTAIVTETDPSIVAYGCEDDNDGNGSGDDDSSTSSLETMSDNVSVWVDGEKHWVSGVDANTTCADLISALVNYQDTAPHLLPTKLSAAAVAAATINQTAFTKEDNNNNNNNYNNNNKSIYNNNKNTLHKIPDYVIVKQHRHCEEFLDSNAKVFDILPAREPNGKKEFELFLRRIEENSSSATTKNFSMMDKDSGMGSPVGSSRSAKFRRKKHKVVNWLAQGNTLHPRSQKASNERLMKIILAQDETIHRQLSLLRDKDHQISKIEEENHKIREKELGKNYLLETYLNGLGEQDMCEEIFVDEPFHSSLTTSTPCDRKRKQTEGDDFNCSSNNHFMENKSPDESSDDIELKIMWMEKVLAINKQLQKEEEILLKIFSKIRKYHVKRAYVTKREMMQQILKIDSDIAIQHADIKQVENSLLLSNQHLKQKLHILENLSREFLEFDGQQTHQKQQQLQQLPKSSFDSTAFVGHGQKYPIDNKFVCNSTSPTTTTAPTPEDLVKLQKLISKPQMEMSSDKNSSKNPVVEHDDRIADYGNEHVDCISKNTKPANVGHSKTIQKQMFTTKSPIKNITELGTLV